MTVKVTIRLKEEEKEMAEKLAHYLFKLGKVNEPTISEAFRLSLHFTVNEILKSIEAERYATA
ncbi:MAG: hypothetical protein JRD89_00560 [Deltaproteobacteria bacterium]|nr:hypothetical protein [Deltaproteobacteria bacterium]